MATADEIRDTVSAAYSLFRPLIKIGRAGFIHQYNVPYPTSLPVGIVLIGRVGPNGGPLIHLVEGEGLPFWFDGADIICFPSFEEMVKSVERTREAAAKP